MLAENDSLRNIRIAIFLIGISLAAIGTVMVYSASAVFAYDIQKDAAYYLKRHVLFLVIGVVSAALIMSIDLNHLRRLAKPLLLLTILLLVLVLIPGIGQSMGGARRWFRLGPFHIQPAELAKFVMTLYLADVLSRKQAFIRNFRLGFLPPVLLLGVVVLLILMQPDLGTAVLICLVALILFFAARVHGGWLLASFLSGIPLLTVLILMEPYRMRRILAFMDPWADPKGTGFQAIQSLLSFGVGGWTGIGLGKSTQKLFYLPGAHTDFIFSIIGEELGFVGCFAVILLFGLLVYFGAKVVLTIKGSFLQLFSLGILSILTLEALINIAVSTAAMPTKGLPLPFISYGGSSLVFHCIGLGLLLNIARQK